MTQPEAAAGRSARATRSCARPRKTQLSNIRRGSAMPARARAGPQVRGCRANQHKRTRRQEATGAEGIGCQRETPLRVFSGEQSQHCGPPQFQDLEMPANIDRHQAYLETDPRPTRSGARAQRRAILVGALAKQLRPAVRGRRWPRPPPQSSGGCSKLFGPGRGVLAPGSGDRRMVAAAAPQDGVRAHLRGFVYPICSPPMRAGLRRRREGLSESCPAAR